MAKQAKKLTQRAARLKAKRMSGRPNEDLAVLHGNSRKYVIYGLSITYTPVNKVTTVKRIQFLC